MAFLTSQTASLIGMDTSTNQHEPGGAFSGQSPVADLITADAEMDLDQEKDLFADELDFSEEDLDFQNPFDDSDDADSLATEVQSLQDEFALAAGHFAQYSPLDFRILPGEAAGDIAVAGFGGFADPAGGSGNQVDLVEEEPLRLRRAEGGRYGFEIVIRGGRAYPVLQEGDQRWQEAGHPVWQGGQQQGIFGGGLGVEGLREVDEDLLVEEDPVEGVAICENEPQAEEVGVLNPENNRAEANDLDIDLRDHGDQRDNHFHSAGFNRAAAAAAVNRIVPAGASPPPPPPRPSFSPPSQIPAITGSQTLVTTLLRTQTTNSASATFSVADMFAEPEMGIVQEGALFARPVIEVQEELPLGVLRNLVADIGTAYEGAHNTVYIGGRGQDGYSRQLASTARSQNGAASGSPLQSGASKRTEKLLRLKSQSMKRKPTQSRTSCQHVLPSMFVMPPAVAVC